MTMSVRGIDLVCLEEQIVSSACDTPCLPLLIVTNAYPRSAAKQSETTPTSSCMRQYVEFFVGDDDLEESRHEYVCVCEMLGRANFPRLESERVNEAGS